jgi:hypothetical protein
MLKNSFRCHAREGGHPENSTKCWILAFAGMTNPCTSSLFQQLVRGCRKVSFENKIIPLLLPPCEHKQFSWALTGYQMVDFTSSFEDGCRDLLRVWGLGYKPK